ncbi:MAG: hypothetical protein QOD46_768 [Actinomycetota bacterium]|nr:hypothetical protein [Actinomycetota bacterium]
MLLALGLAAAVFLVAGRLGYNPTDDGYLLSQSQRILLGQVPHRDFISPRPDVSAYLHLIDLALPLPRMISVRVVGLTEILLYSLFLSVFIIDRPPWRWHFSVAALATIAFLVNLNVFPLMSWYTTDGILLIAIGLLLLRTASRDDRKHLVLLAFFLLGAAATVKQSFALAPVLGGLWLWKEPIKSWARRDWFFAALAAVALPAIYVGYVAMEGGWTRMVTQLTSPPLHEWGQQLVSRYGGRALLLVAVALAAQAGVLWRMLSRERSNLDKSGNRSPLVVGTYIAIVTAVVFFGPLGLALRTWGLTAMWSLIVFLIVQFLCSRTVNVTGLILLLLSWMVSLSFGFAVPDLLGGAIWLFLITQALGGVRAGSWPPIRRWTILLLVMFAAVFVIERRDSPYFDVAAPRLSASLASVSPAFGGIRTGPVTATYLHEYASCTQRYKEPNTAVFPDNAAMYSLLDLHNPFPTDWLWPKSLIGSENWIVSVARRLHEQGHFIVLFQTAPASSLRDVEALPTATKATAPFDYGSDLPTRIFSALGGQKVACGPFVGRYSP